ncbi:hypothetical protein GMDG_06637 [Pseudogymnoascus destructans 20631-21]|uniref:Uncharacterized protein n=1 Tax=Pseudogymnoascus destructans (strain ATCC MYA-4855 / 20631-21) TaxID=658429 RepID=L8FTL8_PSED2|nr:hypothetical protein GMDG_06637 [Pseudogymnoascus destructans 20631-21]
MKDILGPLNILWPEIRKGAHLTKERIRWLETLKGTYQDFDLLLEPDVLPTSWKCLIAADPYRVRQLLNCSNRKTINRLYRCMEQLLVLRRSTATSIPTDSNGSRLQLKSLMPPHEITTALLRMTSSEAVEYQFFHQGFVKRDYEEGLEIWLKEKEHRVDPTADLKSFPCITGPMHSMTINAVSTLLSRFHQTLTHTKHIQLWGGDRPITDASDLLQHLTFGSPKMRWIIKDIMEHCLKPDKDGKRNKLLCSEEIPVSAWYVEMVCKTFYIRAEVLHAGLTDPQHIALVKEFNGPHSSLAVLIMMYAVSSQGANLDVGDSTTEDWTSDKDKPGPSFTPVNRPLLKRKHATLEKTVHSAHGREVPSSSSGPSGEYIPHRIDSESDDDINAIIAPGDLSDDNNGPELTPTDYIKDFKKSWTKLTPEEKALYDQDELDFLVLLSMDPNHVYTGVEIQGTLDSAIADRGLRLVIARRSCLRCLRAKARDIKDQDCVWTPPPSSWSTARRSTPPAFRCPGSSTRNTASLLLPKQQILCHTDIRCTQFAIKLKSKLRNLLLKPTSHHTYLGLSHQQQK